MADTFFYFPVLLLILICSSNFFVNAETSFNNTYFKNSSELDGNEIKPWITDEGKSYRPNSVYVFLILKSENVTNSNVIITIENLDIDIEIGEYLRIGAGSIPLEGPPPLFITSITVKKKILIKDESAYVIFVSESTDKNYTGFHITWEYAGDEKKEDIRNDDILESIPVCFYNVDAVREELRKSFKEDWFKDFRTNLSETAAASYPKRKIKPESVSIFHISGVAKFDETQVVFARIKASKDSEKGRAAFKYSELEGILIKYIAQYSENGADKYQTSLCPQRKMGDTWINELYYLIIPVICIFFLFLFTWKQNPVNKYFAKKKRMKRVSQNEVHSPTNCKEDCASATQNTSENLYSTMPKLEVTNEYGRRFTLKLTDSLLGTENHPEDDIFNKMHTHKRYSDVLDLQRSQMVEGMFSTKHGEENQAFELGEECRQDDSKLELTEHVYDSVESKPDSCVNDVMDTKL